MNPQSPHTPGGRFADDAPAEQPSEALKETLKLVGEAKEYASYYVAAKIDGYKATAKNVGIYAGLGVVGAAIGLTFLVVSVYMLVSGLAGGLSHLAVSLFGERWAWLGPTTLGLIVIGGAVVGILLGMKWIFGSSRSHTVAKYEDRKRKQRSQFGHDVAQRAGR